MGEIILLLMLFGAVLSADYDGSNELPSPLSPAYWRTNPGQRVYWPFAKARIPSPTETKFNIPVPKAQRYVQMLTPDSQDFIIKARPYKPTNDYPIVLTPDKGAFAGALTQPGYDSSPYSEYGFDQYQYRPTQLEYKRPFNERPVITVGPQPKLAYGEPFIRVPYGDGSRGQSYKPSPLVYRPNSSPPREFGPFGNRGPYRPTYPNRATTTPVREYGPFGDQGPYAPKYTSYIPSLKFSHQSRPATGQYDLEYQTANGIYRKETGSLKRISVYNPNTRLYEERVGSVKSGVVAWTSPEGIPFSFSFVADENGYRPTPLVEGTPAQALALAKTTGYQTVIPYQ